MERTGAVTFVVLIILFTCALRLTATAATETGSINRSRFSFEAMTWQEILRIEKTDGSVDSSVANFKGSGFAFERQWRSDMTAWAVGASFSVGAASGGGTSPDFMYKQGDLSWLMFALEPKYIWALSEQIDLLVGATGFYRHIEWPHSSNFRVTPAPDFNGALFAGLDLVLSPQFVFRQTFGFSSVDAGPFWRFAIGYNL